MSLTTTIESWLPVIAEHQTLAYGVLFLGSYLETIIGVCFFIYGEVFFLAGSIAAGAGTLDISLVTGVLLLGGVLGDITSYFLGECYGYRWYRALEHIPFIRHYITEENYLKGCRFFEQHGAKSVFFARLLGPLSWITPFLSGIYRLPFRSFLPYDVLGVVVGIGQFIVVGYFFGVHYDRILPVMSEYLSIAVGGILLLLVLRYLSRARAFRKEPPAQE
ncbi:DedA family protein [Candidatus Peribacteria bacterium]|nr:DedA family protein [Candidatus Peribacteria bacterium]